MNNCSKPVAIVAGLCPTGLAVVRSLGRQGIPVVGVDLNPRAIGFSSRYCMRLESAESIQSKQELISALERFGKSLPTKGVLFPTTDEYLSLISQNAEKLKKYYIFPLEENIVESFLNKKQFYRLCVENNVAIPRTHFPKDIEDLISISREMTYPCILKPVYSHVWQKKLRGQKVFKASSSDELIETYKKVIEFNKEVMVQEIIQGKDDRIYLCAAYFSKNAEPLAIFTGRALRQYPTEFGTKSLAEAVDDPEVAELSIRFLKAINFQGICGVEFKRDPRDNQLKMIEINPRPVRWHSLTDACEVPIVYTAYRDLLGKEVKPVSSQGKGKWIFVWRDLLSATKYVLRRQLSIGNWINSLKGKKEYAIFRWDDPIPFFYFPIYLISQVKKYYSHKAWKQECPQKQRKDDC